LIKLGAVFAPCPTMLTPRDIRYRVNKGKFRMIISDLQNTAKIEEIGNECPALTRRMIVDAEREGWASWPYELLYPAPVSHRSVSMPDTQRTRSKDPMLIYFTSGTTGEPKMVLHDNSYPWVTLLQPASGRMSGTLICILPLPTPAGQSVPGAKFSVNGSRAHVFSFTISPENSRQPKYSPFWKNTRLPHSAVPRQFIGC
jgi:long-subunit acyl-CoA synthetase (AMP-forming)